MAWAFSTVLGIILFLCEIAVLSWVVFYDYSFAAAWAASLLLIPIVIVFMLFAVHFYRKLVTHKYEMTESNIRELEEMTVRLESGKLSGSVPNNNGQVVVGGVTGGVPAVRDASHGSTGSLDNGDPMNSL
jgi:calcium release-activated calcium channel protein 1